jgi:hypothetical protein
MSLATIVNLVRKWIALISISIMIGGSYGVIAAIGTILLLGFSENQALLFVGVPVALGSAAFMWPRLPKILGFDR